MKYLAIIIFILLCFNQVHEARRIKNHKTQKTHTRTHTDSHWYQFFIGFATEFVGGVSIDTCLPEDWKNSTPNAMDKKEVEECVETGTVWGKIKSLLTSAVTVVCWITHLKEYALKYILRLFGWKYRRHLRLFMEGKRTAKYKWEFEGFFKKAESELKEAASSIANKTVKIATEIAEKVKNSAQVAYGKIKEVLGTIFKPVIDLYLSIKEKFVKFWNSPMMLTIRGILDCVKVLANAAYLILKVVANITKIIVRLAAGDPLIWIEIIFALICKWEEFKKLINYIVHAIAATGEQKWNLFGRFLGGLLYNIGMINLIFRR